MTARKVTLERFVVKFRFSKTRPDEMDLDEGDVVLVAAKFNDGWYKGIRLRGYKVGYFPEEVVEKDTAEGESCNGLDLNDEIGKTNLLDMSLTDISTSDMTETSKELKEELKRTRAAQEILSTEISYCNGLDSLVKNFIHPMKLYGVLSVEEIDIIFSNIESLAGISKEMVAKLEKRMSEWNVETTIIGDIFVEMFSYLKMFKPYFDSRSAANQLRIRYEKTNEKFKNFLSKANCAHSLDSLLLMPIQRVPRYELLLKELVKRTSKDHSDFEYLSEALAKAQETATDLNEHIRQIENEAKIFDIIKMFPNDELDLIISNNSNDNNNSPKLKTSIKSKSTLEIPNMGRRTVSMTDLGKFPSGNSLHHAPSDPALHRLNHKHRDSTTHIFKTRMFIREGPVQKVVLRNVNLSQTAELPQEYSERYLILFSDVVFVAVSSGNVLTGNKFKLKERSHLSKCWIMNAEKLLHRQVPPEAFVLGTPKRTYIFIAPAVKEKKTWEKLLHERIAVEKEKFLELWRARPVPNEIFLKTIVKSKVEYRAMNVNELDLCVNEEVSVIGFRKNDVWIPGLYDPESAPSDCTNDWLPGVNSLGKFGWFPAECVYGNFNDSKEKSVDQFSPLSVATALQIKQKMMELTCSKIPVKSFHSIKIHKTDGTFRTCKLKQDTTTSDIINDLHKHNRHTGLDVEKDRIELWEESSDGSVKRKHKEDENIMAILSFWGEYAAQISFVNRIRGIKDDVIESLESPQLEFEETTEKRRAFSFVCKSNSKTESFKKSSSFN